MKKVKRYIRTLYCSECGGKMWATAKVGQRRSEGHLKDMYCPYCKKVTKFVDQGYKKWG